MLKQKHVLSVVLPTIIQPVRLFELVLVGLPVEIPCRAIGWPVPTVRWLRHGQEISNRQNGFFVSKHKKNEARLTTNHMLQMDQGKYNCVATNTLGQDSKVVELMPHGKMGILIIYKYIHRFFCTFLTKFNRLVFCF